MTLIYGNFTWVFSYVSGESVPVTKTPPHACPEVFDPSVHKRHILFCGTEVIQTRYYGGKHVLARVVRTGFSTSKGALIKSILFPAPVGLRFYKDSLKFVFVLFMIAAMGMGYCLYLYIVRGVCVCLFKTSKYLQCVPKFQILIKAVCLLILYSTRNK